MSKDPYRCDRCRRDVSKCTCNDVEESAAPDPDEDRYFQVALSIYSERMKFDKPPFANAASDAITGAETFIRFWRIRESLEKIDQEGRTKLSQLLPGY
jgi:hypothetical protein